MRVAVLHVFSACCAAIALACGNVALRGNATQSSTNWGGSADRAIDGNRNAFFHNQSCTHTKVEAQPWWSVDLMAEERVLVVKVTNRADCCWGRFKDVEVLVGTSFQNNGNNNPVCGRIASLGRGATTTVNCHGMRGRFVNVVAAGGGGGSVLTLCECEVYTLG